MDRDIIAFGRSDHRRRKPVRPVPYNKWMIFAKRRLTATNAAIMDIKNMTKADLGRSLGVASGSALNNWESEKSQNFPKGYTIYLYFCHHDVTPEWIFLGDNRKLSHELAEAIERFYKEEPPITIT